MGNLKENKEDSMCLNVLLYPMRCKVAFVVAFGGPVVAGLGYIGHV